MPLYAYKAIASSGTRHSGYRFGATTDEIYKALKGEGFLLTDCSETKAENFLPCITSRFTTGLFLGIPRSLLIDFCQDMAELDEAGVRADSALEDLALSTPHQGFRTVLQRVNTDVQGGIPLSEALGRHPKVFDRVFQKCIGAAEKTGNFAQQFRHIEHYLRQLDSMSRQVQKLLRSPLILLGLVIIFILIVIDFVIPNMMALMTSVGLKNLPLATRLLLKLAPTLIYIPLLISILIVMLGVSYTIPTSRYILSRFIMVIPIYRSLSLTHFWHVFGVMIRSGIDLIPSLAQATEVINNPYLRDHLKSLSTDIASGSGLSNTFSQERALFSPLVIRYLKLSEQTGRIKELIPQAAAHHHNQALRKMETMISWIEPSLILFMGAIMLWLVLAVIVPFYEIIGNLS